MPVTSRSRALVRVIITTILCIGYLCSPDQYGFAESSITENTASSFWPQWRGPQRTGISTETGLLQLWPESGPPLQWQIPGIGEGYSSVSIADDRIFTMGNIGSDEYVFALDLTTGQMLWRTRNGNGYTNGAGDGPRSTPTIDQERVYALGARGDLSCLRVQDGSMIWTRNILNDFQGGNISWGICESVLIDHHRLIVTPGGKNACIVAVDKQTGETLWQTPGLSDRPGYASPISVQVGSVKQYVTFTSQGLVGVSAQDGRFLWRYDRAANGTANVSTPIFHNGNVFSSSGYGTGCGLVNLSVSGTRIKAEEVYFNRNMQNHHGDVLLFEGHIYGFSGSVLTCLEFQTGAIAWQHRSVGKGSLVYADGHLYCLSENGVIGLVNATPDGYRETGRFRLPERSAWNTWAHPVVAGGRLYIRDKDTLWCYDVADHP